MKPKPNNKSNPAGWPFCVAVAAKKSEIYSTNHDPWRDRERTSRTSLPQAYRRYTAILKAHEVLNFRPSIRIVTLYSRVVPVIGRVIKIDKLDYTIKFIEELTESRLQLGDVPL